MLTKTQKYLFNKLPVNLYKNIFIDFESGCWLWSKNINAGGYGRCHVKGKRLMAHIVIFKLLKYDYDSNLKLDHVYCTDKSCCNPTHLSPVTNSINVNRGSGAMYKKAKPFKLPVDINPDFLSDLFNGIDEPYISAL